MNGDQENTFRLIDAMTEHIVQHVIKVQHLKAICQLFFT